MFQDSQGYAEKPYLRKNYDLLVNLLFLLFLLLLLALYLINFSISFCHFKILFLVCFVLFFFIFTVGGFILIVQFPFWRQEASVGLSSHILGLQDSIMSPECSSF